MRVCSLTQGLLYLHGGFDQRLEGSTSLAVQWLKLLASTAGDVGSIPGWGTKIPHAMVWPKKKKKAAAAEGASGVDVRGREFRQREQPALKWQPLERPPETAGLVWMGWGEHKRVRTDTGDKLGGWMRRLWYIHTMEYYSAKKGTHLSQF